MASSSKKVLIVHTGHTLCWAEQFVKGIMSAGEIEAVTLQFVLLSGKPLNITEIVDESAGVIVLYDEFLLGDSIASAIVSYSKKLGNVKPIRTGSTDIGFRAYFYDLGKLPLSPLQTDKFWTSLEIFINFKSLR